MVWNHVRREKKEMREILLNFFLIQWFHFNGRRKRKQKRKEREEEKRRKMEERGSGMVNGIKIKWIHPLSFFLSFSCFFPSSHHWCSFWVLLLKNEREEETGWKETGMSKCVRKLKCLRSFKSLSSFLFSLFVFSSFLFLWRKRDIERRTKWKEDGKEESDLKEEKKTWKSDLERNENEWILCPSDLSLSPLSRFLLYLHDFFLLSHSQFFLSNPIPVHFSHCTFSTVSISSLFDSYSFNILKIRKCVSITHIKNSVSSLSFLFSLSLSDRNVSFNTSKEVFKSNFLSMKK